MGTSTGYTLPTSGNWGNFKRNVTGLGQSGAASPSAVGRTLGNYVQAHGGASSLAQQMATANQAGATLGGFLAGVRSGGLGESLRGIGLSNLIGKPASDVMRGFLNYLVGTSSLLNDDLVRNAFQDYQEEIAGHCETYEELEIVLSRAAVLDTVEDNLKRFFGFFIFRKFQRDCGEQLLKTCDTKYTARRILQTVQDYIFEKINQLTQDRDLGQFNWRGQEGIALAQKIQEKAWRIFGEG